MVEQRQEFELVARAEEQAEKVAVLDADGSHRYGDLLRSSGSVATTLLEELDVRDLDESPVCYLVPPEFSYVAVLWGIWRAGGMAVPLATSHPPRELGYVLDDARPPIVVTHPSMADRLGPLARERGLPLVSTRELGMDGGPELDADDDGHGPSTITGDPSSGSETPSVAPDDLPGVATDRAALMLYTSGTTGPPKGVVHTHSSLEAQMRALTRAWEWSEDDRILLVLPLHHLHGLMNVLCCALWSGASCRMHPGFDATETWEAIAGGDMTLFMAVPTIYHRLARSWDGRNEDVQDAWSRGAEAMRLMVSGSAALPVTLLEKWEAISGHRLLERYGMTETGMILSNPLHGERRPGHVGQPLPGMEVRLVAEESDGDVEHPENPENAENAEDAENAKNAANTDTERAAGAGSAGVAGDPAQEGGVQVRGETLFREYRDRPDATAEAFTDDGWFRTGDVARLEDGSYRLLGRRSVDILKSGGYKISALEIESVLLEHPAIAEVAVVGVPDPEWGQVVSAALVSTAASPAEPGPGEQPTGRGTESERAGSGQPEVGSAASANTLEPDALRAWAKERLAPYKVPSRFLLVDDLPRNAMGKVQKPEVVELFETAR